MYVYNRRAFQASEIARSYWTPPFLEWGCWRSLGAGELTKRFVCPSKYINCVDTVTYNRFNSVYGAQRVCRARRKRFAPEPASPLMLQQERVMIRF